MKMNNKMISYDHKEQHMKYLHLKNAIKISVTCLQNIPHIKQQLTQYTYIYIYIQTNTQGVHG